MLQTTRTMRSNLCVLLLGFALAGCAGLSSEPPVVSTVMWPSSTPQLTAIATTQATGQAVQQQPTLIATEVVGSVNGQITNGTAGGSIPTNTQVTLHVSDDSSVSETTFTAMTDAGGSFNFANVPIRESAYYVVTVAYQGRIASSEFAAGNTAVTKMTLPIKLYEWTSDPAVLSITSFITNVNVDKDGLMVAQVIHLKNHSDRVFSTDNMIAGAAGNKQYSSVSFALPNGAQLMGFSDNSGRFIVAPDGSSIFDTMPVVPDTDHVVHFIYTLPPESNRALLEQVLPYPFNGDAQLMISPASISANTGLPDQGIQSQSTSTFHLYSGSVSFKSGDSLRYELPDLSAGTTTPKASAGGAFVSNDLLIGLLIGGGLGLIVLGLILLFLERRKQVRVALVPAGDSSGRGQIDHLILQMAQLDERHDKGTITQAVYETKRARLKAQLAQLMKHQVG